LTVYDWISAQSAEIAQGVDRAERTEQGAGDQGIMFGYASDETGELMPLIARRKKFTVLPMNEEEAIEQMRLLGHDNFFVFFNAERNAIQVLYRRRNGSYGLIEPVIG